MSPEDFYETVRRTAPVESTAEARDVTAATLRTLGEHLGDADAAALAEPLPDEIAEPLREGGEGPAEGYAYDEFVARVSERAGVPEADVLPDARAVVAAFRDAVDPAAFADAREQLPAEFDIVLEPGAPTSDDLFLRDVARVAGVDPGTARAAADATLTTLGERLSAGEGEDLATYLPPGFDDQLVAGNEGAQPDFSAAEFVSRVADRLGTDEGTARGLARAVIAAVAAVASETELERAWSQLPGDYDALLTTANQRGATVEPRQ